MTKGKDLMQSCTVFQETYKFLENSKYLKYRSTKNNEFLNKYTYKY